MLVLCIVHITSIKLGTCMKKESMFWIKYIKIIFFVIYIYIEFEYEYNEIQLNFDFKKKNSIEFL